MLKQILVGHSKIIKAAFPKINRLHKIFNENTVKVSCSYLSNMSSIIPSLSKRLLRPITMEHCNCGTRENCSLQNQCLTPNLVYQVDVKSNANIGTKVYFGLAETSSKAWFANQKKILTMSNTKKTQNCQNIYGR